MYLKLLFATCFIVALITTESAARKGRNGPSGRARGNRNFRKGGMAIIEKQFRKICNKFDDHEEVSNQCDDAKEKIRTFMNKKDEERKTFRNKKEEETKLFMEEQKEALETVVKAVCTGIEDNNSATTCNGRIKANICKKLNN